MGAGSSGLESPRACHGGRRDGSQARLGTCVGRRAGVVNTCVCLVDECVCVAYVSARLYFSIPEFNLPQAIVCIGG